jgi:hypothetical protein
MIDEDDKDHIDDGRDEYEDRLFDKMQGFRDIFEATRLIDIEDAVFKIYAIDLCYNDKYQWAYPTAIYGRLKDVRPDLKATEDEVRDACKYWVTAGELFCQQYEYGDKYIYKSIR